MERGELIDGCFWIDRCLHRSAAIDVYRAVDVRDSSLVLVRVYVALSSTGLEHFSRTCTLLAEHPHPAIERLVAWGSFSESAVYAAVAPPAGPTLAEAMEHGVSGSDAMIVTKRALGALRHLHALRVAHGDITARAIVLPQGDASLATLTGLALVPSALIAVEDSMPSVQVETASHLAPELVRTPGRPTTDADMFALGCVLYRSVTGQLPFASQGGVVGTFLRVLYDEPALPRTTGRREPWVLSTLAMRMLAKDPAARPTAADALAALEHPETVGIESEPSTLVPASRRVGIVLCEELERGHASLAREGELERVERQLDVLGGRLDRLHSGTLLIEIDATKSGDGLIRTARAALLLQSALPTSKIVIARGAAGGIDAAEVLLAGAAAGRVTVLPELVPAFERDFDIEPTPHGSVLWEREPHTEERTEAARRRPGSKTGPEIAAVPWPATEFDGEVTIVEHKRRTLELAIASSLEQQPTLEMDLSALARATVPGSSPPAMQHDDTDPEYPRE